MNLSFVNFVYELNFALRDCLFTFSFICHSLTFTLTCRYSIFTFIFSSFALIINILHWETKAHRSLEVHLLVPLATWTCLTIAKKVEWLAKKLNQCILDLSLWCLLLMGKFSGSLGFMDCCDLILHCKCFKVCNLGMLFYCYQCTKCSFSSKQGPYSMNYKHCRFTLDHNT